MMLSRSRSRRFSSEISCLYLVQNDCPCIAIDVPDFLEKLLLAISRARVLGVLRRLRLVVFSASICSLVTPGSRGHRKEG